jgi:hypothetical protein
MFRIASNQFGYLMFSSPVDGGWSDVVSEAHVYDSRDSRETKLNYWRAFAVSCGLNPALVLIVED